MSGDAQAGSLDIRPASPFEAPLLAALHAACFQATHRPMSQSPSPQPSRTQTPWDDAAMGGFIADPSTLCILCVLGAPAPDPAGFLIARHSGEEADLLSIGVLKEHRAQGIGTALMEYAGNALRSAGAKHLFLEVEETNELARRLYGRLGAVSVGRRKAYYENGQDAEVLRLDLASLPPRDQRRP